MNKVHSQGRVPFSWENKPGESKISSTKSKDFDHDNKFIQFEDGAKLPPPPCHQAENVNKVGSFHDLQIPLPPCAFQPPTQRSSSKKHPKKNDDPFMIAIKQCTKSNGDDQSARNNSGFGMKKKKNKSLFSCKQSCNVVDGSILKVSQLPISKSQRENDRFVKDE
ncbi:hypothetical protein LIER_13157 [Lithospermum erythrorhizon]|uniref:Uncharacterized protein n=1 Tax=Lithospermum erythrorhizon TaxID=34254 RepID=A0AAV3PWF6_LITER